MYYFKCGNCGYLNHVNSEYLIFCSNCGKKLQTIYRDWHLKNPEKNLNDFHELFCVSEEEKKSTPQKVQKRSYKKPLYLGLLVFIIFFALIIESLIIPDFFMSRTETHEIKSEKWTEKKIRNISVKTPFLFIDASSNIKNEIVEDFKNFAYTSSEGFEMLITYIKYTENISEKYMNSISSDPINQMQSNSSISNMEFIKTNNIINDIKGLLHKGSYLRTNEKFEFIEATYAQKAYLWQLIIVYKPENKWDKYKAYRILNSLNID